eukprot:15363551-Ditylum_brightwellii.AAC.1
MTKWQMSVKRDSTDSKTCVSQCECNFPIYIENYALTAFSRGVTAGCTNAVNGLEKVGAQSYILDVRDTYDGFVQVAILTASDLLRDLHPALYSTLNARGDFTGHDAEEYLTDAEEYLTNTRLSGNFLSSKSSLVSLEQAMRDGPTYFKDPKVSKWAPPSAYVSLRQQNVQRKINRGISSASEDSIHAQMKGVLFMNDGAASSAETYCNDGIKDTWEKSDIIYAFPMTDGGGLRIAVVTTNAGCARYNATEDLAGVGIYPDIRCISNQGIPRNIGGDICVGVTLDALAATNQE